MNVTEFKARIKEIEANQNVHYKIVYKEFKDALEQKKRHSFWHDSPKLAEITNANKEKIEFFVEGNLNADVCSETGDTIASFENCLSPIEGVLETDDDVHRLESMDDGDYMLVNSANYVVAVYKDKKIRFKDPDIVNCIFDEEKIASIFSESQDIPEPKKEAEPEKEEIPEPVFKEEPSEEPVQEKAPKKEAKPEKTVSSGKMEITSKGRCDLLPLDIVSEFFDAKSEGKSELEEMAEYQKDNDYKHLDRKSVV